MGQVSPDQFLLTLIDPWLVLLDSLDSDNTILIGFLHCFFTLSVVEVSQDQCLLTLTDPWLVLFDSLDSDKTIHICFFHCFFFFLWFRSGQSRYFPFNFDRSVVGSPQ